MGFAFIRPGTKIDFIGKRHWAYGISVILVLVGLASMLMGQGLKMGIDFAGGVIAQIQFEQPVKDDVLKKSLDVPALPGISTQRFGDGDRDYLLRFSQSENADASQLLFEIHGLILALHYEARFLHSDGSIERAHAGFNNILARYASEPPAA